MRVQDLYIYPVKSLGGIRREMSMALQRGFLFDRRWMLIDETGKFISQRTEHQLALFQTEIPGDFIKVYQKNFPDEYVSFPLDSAATKTTFVSVWDDITTGYFVSPELDQWFSGKLGRDCRLVFFPENGTRPVDVRYAENDEQVAFADAFPYLLISQASLDDLNSRLENPVPMNRFRPNIVVTGTEAFAEDSWKEIKIGQVRFKVAKPCARCVLTTVDQDTGIKGKEPLNTLASYRTINKKVLFGQNLIALNEGLISINDEVVILK